MKSVLRILLIVAVALAIVHFWPVTLVPLALGLLATVLLGSLFAGVGVVLLVLLGIGVAALLLTGATVLAALSPLWIPALALIGLLALVRPGKGKPERSFRAAAQG